MKTIGRLGFVVVAGTIFIATSIFGKAERLDHHDTAVIKTLKEHEDLRQVIGDTTGTVIVDFYSDWCGPCRIQASVLREAADRLGGEELRIVKVDVEIHDELASYLEVNSIPTLFVFEDGELIERHVGIANQQVVHQWLHTPLRKR